MWLFLKDAEKVEQPFKNQKKINKMNTVAIITMVLTQGLVTGFAVYFFYKVLTIPPRQEPDSFSENDDEDVRQDADKE